jgi:outer membrane protein assembly factor BamB
VGLSWSVAGGDKDGTVKWDPLNPYSATYTAPATVAASRQVQVDAVTDVDPRFAGHLVITIVPKKAVVVTITSAPTSLIAGNTAQLTAQVLNATDTRVTWKATYGKVDSNGLYTAPDAPPPGGSDTVTATSVADTTKSDSAAILILPRLAITGGPNATPGKDGRSATITWTTNIDADGMVEFGTDTNYGAFVKQGDVNLVKSHLALITAGLTPGVTYHYRVKSGAPGQATVTSADATFTTPAPPISGTPPFATTTATTATITWSTDPQASGRVDYGLAQDKLDNAVPISGPDVSQHEVTLSGLTPNTTYYFRVTSSKQGYSSFTADGVFRTNALPSLVIVAGPNAKLVAPTTVLVTWSTNAPSNGIVGYGPNGQFTGQKGDYGTPPGVDHSVTLDGLDQNTLYQYQVTARAAGYNDAVSDVLTFKVPARYLPPKDLVASPEVTTATITWKTDAPATVKVEYGLDPGSLTKTVAGPSDPSTDHSVRLTDLTPSTLYYFRVTNQAKGYTDTTQDGSFYTFAPGQVVARNIAQMLNPPSASGGDWSAVITWETDVDSDGMVEYGTDETSLSSAVETAAPGKQHSVTITGLKPGTTYVYRVRSKAAGYTEGVSAFRTFTVTVERPAVHVVVAPRAENVHATDAEITWVTDVESDSTVEYGTGGAYNQKAQDSALTTSHRVKLAGLTSATQYSFRVTSSRDGYDPGTANDPSQKFTTKARVTIASQPDVPGWSVTVDSAVLPATSQRIQLEWAIGEPHKVAAPTPVDAGTGKRYVFTGWADGSPARERDVSVTGDTNLTAQYTAQFFLQVNTSPNIADASVTTGQDWYAQGSTATVTARDSISIGGVAYRLSKWRLDNVEAPAGPLNVKMDAPHNATAVYERSDTVGPAVAEVRAAPNPTAGAKAVTVRALISDLGLGDSQIAAAEYSVDTAAPAGSGVAMSAEDGAFNSAREYVVATVPADAWKAGTTHRIYVRGRDAQGNWGATGFVEVVVTAATGAPSAVTDLRASRQGTDRIGLAWTAPGGVAVAAAYDVRMSTSPISESSFSSATPVPGAPVPGSAGTPQAMLVTGLSPDTLYYFALKARDDAGNWSGMSNLASATTGGPPPTVTAVSPLDGATQVAVDVPISITFSKAMDATSVALDANPPIGALSPSWSADRRTVTFTHAQLQGDSTIYQLRVTAAKDANGNDLAQPYAWSFTTIPPVNTGLAITPWPMFRRDSQHTGQSPYVGPSQPVQQWTASVRTAVSSPAMTNDRTLYVGSTGKALYALDGQTGQEKWSYGESSWVYSSPAIAVDGTVYIGLPSGGLHAVNPDGTRKWVFDEDQSPIRSSPAIGDDGTIFVGTDRGMYAVTPGGSKLWQFPTVAPVISSPALTSDGATVVFGCEDATLYALDAKTGVKKWTFKVQSVIRSSPVVGPDGTIYISSDDGYTYAIDPAKLSQPKWMAQTGTVGMSSPALADGRLYVGNSAGVLYAINLATGQTEWSYATNGAILGSPCVDHNGVIYVASSGDQQQRVYAFAGTGEVKWTWDVGSRISSSPVIGDDGTLYIGAQDKMIALRNLSNIMPGDLDGDGQVTVRDAQVALLIALDIKPATDVQRQAADLDKSGKVGVNDVSRILLRAIGLAPDPWP